MNAMDIIITVVVAVIIMLIYFSLGNQRKNVHGCTGGGLTVEKSTKESE
jgi:hypothetical protein